MTKLTSIQSSTFISVMVILFIVKSTKEAVNYNLNFQKPEESMKLNQENIDSSIQNEPPTDEFLCPLNGEIPTNFSGILRGTILFDDSESVYIVVYSKARNEHLVYERQARSAIRPFEGKFIAQGIQPVRMKELWGFEPGQSLRYIVGLNNIVYKVRETNKTKISRALLLFHEKQVDYLMIDDYGTVYYNVLTSSDLSIGVVFSPEGKGLHYFYESQKRRNVIASDMAYVSGTFWDEPNQYYMVESRSDPRMWFMKKAGPNREEKFAQWTMVNGFVYDRSYVHLFTDNFVYIFIDSFNAKHGFMEFSYKGLRVPYNDYFHCNGHFEFVQFKMVEARSVHRYRKVFIFALMGSHLFVAFVLFVLIIKVSLVDTRSNEDKSDSGRSTLKRVPSSQLSLSSTLSSILSKSSKSSKTSGTNSTTTTTTTTTTTIYKDYHGKQKFQKIGNNIPSSERRRLYRERRSHLVSGSMLSNEKLPKLSGFEPRNRPSLISLEKIERFKN